MFIFTHVKILNAIVAVLRRGVSVRLIPDYRQMNSADSQVKKLFDLGKTNPEFKLSIRVHHSETFLMHDKFAILDGKILVSESFNWSVHALSNAENVVIWRVGIVTRLFQAEFERMWSAFIGPASGSVVLDTCALCQLPVPVKNICVMKLRCGHRFHDKCILPRLDEDLRCPTCGKLDTIS